MGGIFTQWSLGPGRLLLAELPGNSTKATDGRTIVGKPDRVQKEKAKKVHMWALILA